MSTYRRALRVAGSTDLGRKFHNELRRSSHAPLLDAPGALMAIRVERRTVAAAVFRDMHLEYADARQLSSNHAKALSSAAGFVRWLLSRFPVESSAVEEIPEKKEILRRAVHETITATLREQMISVWQVPRSVLLESFG